MFWAKTLRYDDLSKDQEPLLPLQFCSDCITATRGYDFWEGQLKTPPHPNWWPTNLRKKANKSRGKPKQSLGRKKKAPPKRG